MRPVSLLLLLALAAPAEAVAQDDPCAGVSCSNHGTCVTKGGDPACACDEGFIPDQTTGLSCQPAAPAPVPDEARTVDPRSARAVALAGIGISMVAVLAHVSKVATMSYVLGKAHPSWSELDASLTAWFALHVSEMALHAGGVSMALGGAMAIRRSLGLKMTTPVNIAGWAFYAGTWAVELLAILPVGLSGILTFVGIPLLLTSVGLACADVAAASRLVGASGREARLPSIVPGVVPVPGGGVVTLGGRF